MCLQYIILPVNFFLSYCSHLETVKANTKINSLELVMNFWEDHLLFPSLQRDERDNNLLYELANIVNNTLTFHNKINCIFHIPIHVIKYVSYILVTESFTKEKHDLPDHPLKKKYIETAFEITERTVWRNQSGNNQKP